MDKLERLAAAEGMEDPCLLTRNLHIYPDFHGNRAPLADHTMRGMVGIVIGYSYHEGHGGYSVSGICFLIDRLRLVVAGADFFRRILLLSLNKCILARVAACL